MGLRNILRIFRKEPEVSNAEPINDCFLEEFQLGSVICPESLKPEYKQEIEFLIYDYNGAIHTLVFDSKSDPLKSATYAIDSIIRKENKKMSILLLLREVEN